MSIDIRREKLAKLRTQLGKQNTKQEIGKETADELYSLVTNPSLDSRETDVC